ncbi:MAG: hypothetical protein FVQ83_09415 [Chloroflexi bacterium]|nr:hypothetical protein [Chloroflexota bacterium]
MLPTSLVEIFIFSFLFAIGAVVSPGPVSTAIVSQSARHGWLVGPLVATGHSILELVIVVLIAFGLTAGMAEPAIQIFIAFVGGLLLIWMGGMMMLGIWRGEIRVPGVSADTESMTNRQIVILGMVTTISNPFWYAWWVTSAAVVLAQAQAAGYPSVAAFYVGHISADYAWDTVLSAIVGGGKRWITDNIYRGIIGASGLFFVYVGVNFLLQSFKLASG